MWQHWRPEHVQPCLPAIEASQETNYAAGRQIAVRQSQTAAEIKPWRGSSGKTKTKRAINWTVHTKRYANKQTNLLFVFVMMRFDCRRLGDGCQLGRKRLCLCTCILWCDLKRPLSFFYDLKVNCHSQRHVEAQCALLLVLWKVTPHRRDGHVSSGEKVRSPPWFRSLTLSRVSSGRERRDKSKFMSLSLAK